MFLSRRTFRDGSPATTRRNDWFEIRVACLRLNTEYTQWAKLSCAVFSADSARRADFVLIFGIAIEAGGAEKDHFNFLDNLFLT
jgi:hypothetical protein